MSRKRIRLAKKTRTATKKTRATTALQRELDAAANARAAEESGVADVDIPVAGKPTPRRSPGGHNRR
jgi:hypothetical protein